MSPTIEFYPARLAGLGQGDNHWIAPKPDQSGVFLGSTGAKSGTISRKSAPMHDVLTSTGNADAASDGTTPRDSSTSAVLTGATPRHKRHNLRHKLSTHRAPTTTTPANSPVRRPLGGDTAMDQDGKVCPVCGFYMGAA